MDTLKIIWVQILLFIVSASAEFQFTAPTENCVFGSACNLKCGPIDSSENVQFLRGGKPFLTCLSRNSFESPCLIVPDSENPGYSTYFDSRKSEIILKTPIKETDDGSIWTCKNGNQEDSVNVTAGYRSLVGKFSPTNYIVTVGQEVSIICQVVVYEAITFDPSMVTTTITSNSDYSNLTTTVSKGNYLNYRATLKLKCTDHYFTCFSTTGFGALSQKYLELNVPCPIEIFYDMITTNVTIELGKSRDLELYYSGYPVTTRWYKNFPEGDMRLNRINNVIDLPIGSRKEIMFITNANFDDAGQYTVHVRQNDTVIKVVYHVIIRDPNANTPVPIATDKPLPTSIAPTGNEITFAGPPEKCVHGKKCSLKCGEIDRSNNVEFYRDDKLFLTCVQRNSFSPCLIPDENLNTDIAKIQHSTYFDWRSSTMVLTIVFKENDFVSHWTCKNGYSKASVFVEADYGVFVKQFTTQSYLKSVGQTVALSCEIEGLIVDSSFTWPDMSTSITRNGDASNLTTTVSQGYYDMVITATPILKCTDHYFTCFATSGFGLRSQKYVEIYVKCPIEIFYDMITTNVTIELGKRRDLELYYSGYPVTTRWYKNFPEGDMQLNRINNVIDLPIGSRKEIMFITNANFDDAGQYTVHVQQNDTVIKVVYHVTIVVPTTTTTSYASKHNTSTTSPRFSTSVKPNPKYTTADKHNVTNAPHSTNPKYTTTAITKSTSKNAELDAVVTKDGNGSCQQFSCALTLVILAFLSYKFV